MLVDIEGKRVKIIGRIEIRKGKPEIRINAAPQIEYPGRLAPPPPAQLIQPGVPKNRASLDGAFLTKGEQSMLATAPLRAREIAMNPPGGLGE